MTSRFPAPWRIVELPKRIRRRGRHGKQIGVFYGRAPDIAGHTGLHDDGRGAADGSRFRQVAEMLNGGLTE